MLIFLIFASLNIILALIQIPSFLNQTFEQRRLILILSNVDFNIFSAKKALNLKSVQVMVRLHIFPIFSFLAKMLSFLLRDDNIFARNEKSEKYASGQ